MSALPPRADIFRGGSDVRFVPKADIPVLVAISMQIGTVAMIANSIQPGCLPSRDVMCHAGNEVGLAERGHPQSLRTIKSFRRRGWVLDLSVPCL